MTTKEYISNVLVKFNVSESDIDIIILDNDLEGETKVDIVEAKTAIHKNLSTWLPIHLSIDEGNVSEAWNHEAVLMYYSLLCKELGLDNLVEGDEAKNEINDKSDLW